MNKIKTLIILALMFFSGVSFAAWTQPTANPPAGNTQPPINVGTSDQIKKAMIGATEFCIYNSAGAEVSCLGGSNPDNPTPFPWIFEGDNIYNTNTTNKVFVGGKNADFLGIWKNLTEWTNNQIKLAVNGTIIAKGFCLGQSCIDINTGGVGDTINNWSEVIKSFVSTVEGPLGPVGPAGATGSSASNPMNCKPGEVLTWTQYGISPTLHTSGHVDRVVSRVRQA